MEDAFAELQKMDDSLTHSAFGDLAALQALLPRRAEVLGEIVKHSADLTAAQVQILQRSRHTTDAAIRQVRLTRNLLLQEMSQLTQEQRLWASMTAQSPERSSHWSLEG